MQNIVLVALGGATGATARYLASGAALRVMGPDWPWGTFAVNIVGSGLMGMLIGWLVGLDVKGATPAILTSANWRLLLATGVLGGFTTFSAFSLETANMIERKAYSAAAVYSIGSVVLGVAALFAGLAIARKVFAS